MADVRRILADLWGKNKNLVNNLLRNFVTSTASLFVEFCKAMDYLLNIKECHPS